MSSSILLIDDEEQFAKMLQELLHLNGYEAEFSLNPKEALVRLQHENYELVITDYKMPEMDGGQFLEAIRKVHPDLPVIMISGLMNMPELIKVANIGVTLVLEKPFKTDELLENVARFVNPKSPQELAEQAMDMEASEIDLQPDSMDYTYPAPAQMIADASDGNKRFLEAIWRNASEYRHIACHAPKGAEVRLLGSEMMSWLDQDTGKDPVRIDLADTGTEVTQEWVLERPSLSGIFLIDGRQSSWNEETIKTLVDWVKYVENSGKDLSLTRVVYILPMGAPFDVAQLPMDDSLKALFASECPVLLSLRERLPDVAVYINRYFSAEEKAALGKDLLIRLLHYSWPGGYIELLKTMNAIRARFETGTVLTEEQLKSEILQNSQDPRSLESSLTLEGYLKRRQREYLALHAEPEEDLKDTLLRMGVDHNKLDTEAILTDKTLIYPELLNHE